MSSTKIGIFDSGVGGLTLAGAIHKKLPDEAILYYGDTAHFPYGDKSAKTIANYSETITKYLLQNDVKLIVVACNTASANGLNAVNKIADNTVPVIDVINPVAQYIAEKYTNQTIGVVATRGTIAANIYPTTIRQYTKSVKVVSKATPLLAPLIEEGLDDKNINAGIVNHYVKQGDFSNISALVLGCTHYPLLKNYFQEALGSTVEIIDAVDVVANRVNELLKNNQILAEVPLFSQSCFEISDLTPFFQSIAPTFFSAPIRLSHYNIWQEEKPQLV